MDESKECSDLLTRIAAEDVLAFTTTEILNEVCHKLMLWEAHDKQLIQRRSAAAVRARSSVIPTLHQYWLDMETLLGLRIPVMPLDEERLFAAHQIRQSFPLLTTDSIILAAAHQFGITSLATRDRDFEVVPWLTVYRPTDVPAS